MSEIFKLKPVFNKLNGQINLALPKKKLPEDLKVKLKECEKISFLKFKFKGVEFK